MDSTQTLSVDQVNIDVGDMTDTDQFLTFMLAGEEYGVDILRVQEIKGWDAVTTIPNTPEYLRGVINLRGTIVPIIDMRIRFGIEKLDYGPLTVVVVLKVDNEERNRVIGIVVDGVSDVYNVPEDEIKPSPDFGSAVDTEFVRGLATIDKKMVIVLDIDQMFNSGDLEIMDSCIDE
ncbi:Positive regulator of CheA protein activity (CheW) [hydrothermal vent metagenome]|uniref:Chemotaxis protein CheW n=1 Tax=hydrothermal vent metagenome TaxID=652676 RepID=A0A3B1B6I7_9ZZZZ